MVHKKNIVRATCVFCVALVTLMMAGLGTLPVQAAEIYPTKPVRVIVPNSVGSTADIVARVVAEGLSQELAQQFYVENNAGAAGITGTRQFITSNPDGYTVAVISSSHAIKPALHVKLPYDTLKDIAPIAMLGTTPLVLVVGPDSPYTTVQALISAARTKPESITYGSNGNGSALHLAGEMFKSKASIDILHVPYKGVNTLMTDLMGGHIQAAFLAAPSAVAQIQAGKLRALAVSTSVRLQALSKVPTLAEAGVTGYSYDAWIAMVGPAGMPKEVIGRLQQATARVLASSKVTALFAEQSFVGDGRGSEDARRIIAAEVEKSFALVKSASITPE